MFVDGDLFLAEAGLGKRGSDATNGAPLARRVFDDVVAQLIPVRCTKDGVDEDFTREGLLALGDHVFHTILVFELEVEHR